ncbi:MAG TPA: adenylate/guanylate cyclase domain-containing protein [Burkholderiaceae bacterium]|nr:adenylate/guanylate cyclase domain-containing protein [Burkholderiaceae bacterium]
MGVNKTVVFADLTGSTALFETLGNEKAADAVTRLTQWISEIFTANSGSVVKKLGDGVLGTFPRAEDALHAMVYMQRGHQRRLKRWPPKIRMEIRVGVASGEVVEVGGDCYGDAVNMASRLSDLSGAHQIWASEAVVEQIPDSSNLRFRNLGPINVRGRTEALTVYQVEWEEDASSELLTMQAALPEAAMREDSILGNIQLMWLDTNRSFSSTELPVHLGRATDAEMFVDDPRVSRLHAKIDWRHGSFVLVDLSSFGTWVRFAGSDTDVHLRRDECLLHGHGEIGLGMPCNDLSAATVRFNVSGSTVEIG